MSIQIIQSELRLNKLALQYCTNTTELIQLLNQRANLKDMMIELLQLELDNRKAA